MKNLIRSVLLGTIASLFLAGCKKVEKDYYPNGNLKSVIEFKNGKEHGKLIFYDPNYKTPTLEITMEHGKKNGKLTRYHFNGKIETIAYYVDDIQEGEESIYDLKGNRIIENHFVHGKKNGPYRSWHERDVIKEEGAYLDDLYDGEWFFWDERGMLIGEAVYDKGTGKQISYDSKGNLHRITHYVNNLKDGEDIYFSPSGDTLKVIIFAEDRIVEIRE